MNKVIYLDYNATTPVLPEVLSVLIYYSKDTFGNPSSIHKLGEEAKRALENFRITLAELLSAKAEEIIFTSGGTEANHLALWGVMNRFKKGHLVVSAFEHPSILKPAIKLLELGYEVDFVRVSPEGYIEPEEVKKFLKKDTKLVSIMLANNEIGTIQPIQEIGDILKEREILFHTDACQAIGKIPVNFKELKVDLLSLAGHKFYAPKGIGALVVRKGVQIEPLFLGGGQERGLRAGTEPLGLIGALTKACEIVVKDLPGERERLFFLKEKLYFGLKEIYPKLYRYGIPEKTLPNTLTVSFVGQKAWEILENLPLICASLGSACHSRKGPQGSITLQALKIPLEIQEGTIRFSLGKFTTLEDIEETLHLFKNLLFKKG